MLYLITEILLRV